MTVNLAKHKSILVKILKDIYSDPNIGPILGFKGGTAAILSGMGELFNERQKNGVRKNLKDELRFQIRLYLETKYSM